MKYLKVKWINLSGWFMVDKDCKLALISKMPYAQGLAGFLKELTTVCINMVFQKHTSC